MIQEVVLVLNSRKWTLCPVVWIPLLIRLQNCGIYYHRTSRNAIVAVVIYAILTMFKWCHIDSSLFYISPPLVMPYASNACSVILFYVICIDSKGFTLTVNCLSYWCDILTIDNCHVWLLRNWISMYSMCVFLSVFHLIYRLYHIIRHHHPVA